MSSNIKQILFRFYPLFTAFILLMMLMTISRYVCYLMVADLINETDSAAYLKNCFTTGAQFDLQICSYLIIVPFIITLVEIFKSLRWATAFKKWYFIILFTLVVGAIGIDFNYFRYFNNRLSVSTFLWFTSPEQTLKFIFTEKSFFPYLIAIAAISILLSFCMIRLFSTKKNNTQITASPALKTTIAIILSFLFFYGIRGAKVLRPIGTKDAFFSNNASINQITLNCILTFSESTPLFKKSFYNLNESIRFIQTDYNTGSNENPYVRTIISDSTENKKNIVLILMESMSANVMKYFGNNKNLSPFLDSLLYESLFFKNAYSSGIHTYNGLFATLYGYPSLPNQHPLANPDIINQTFNSMPSVLKNTGYNTYFFCPHHEEFDNMGFFLRKNGFDTLYSTSHFPKDANATSWGVSDEFLYNFTINKLNKAYEKNQLFFATILTLSTHVPPEFPRNTIFKPSSDNTHEQVYQYSDWALRNFIYRCKKEKWYSNTLFVLVGDHGMNFDRDYEVALSYVHVPLLIFNSNVNDTILTSHAMQTDIFPTVMGLMNLGYTNSTTGKNLFKEKRNNAYFVFDEKIACINDTFLYIKNGFGFESMYEYWKKSKTDVKDMHTTNFETLKKQALCNMETVNWLLKKNTIK